MVPELALNLTFKKPPLVVYDTVDDRKEAVRLLARVPPWVRVGWMDWCCREVNRNGHSALKQQVSRDTRLLAHKARWDDSCDQRLTQECWSDIWYLACQHSLDMDKALERLVALAKKYGRRLT
jgi:hypothetical protein